MRNKKISLMSLILLIFFLWQFDPPQGMNINSYHMLIIFVTTILGLIIQPYPISVISLIGASIAILTKTVGIKDLFADFGSNVVWIIILAFFIAKCFIKTGMGKRIAYWFISKTGHSTLMLSYGIITTECILAPLIPSMAARSGGIIFPIAQSVIEAYSSTSSENAKYFREYVMHLCNHSSILSSAWFFTAMAGNPLIAQMASKYGEGINWSTWFLGALIPSLVSFIIIPPLLMLLSPPKIYKSTKAPQLAKSELAKMGKINKTEKIMLFIFLLLVLGWSMESFFGYDSTTIALFGAVSLIVMDIITWQEALEEKNAWDNMVWFAILLSMSSQLDKMGVMSYFANIIENSINLNYPSYFNMIILSSIYFYSHYFFASLTAHIVVFYTIFLKLFLFIGLPFMPSALLLGYLSNAYGSLTHYGSSSAPIFFAGSNKNTLTWWKTSFILSSVQFLNWLFIGYYWLTYIFD